MTAYQIIDDARSKLAAIFADAPLADKATIAAAAVAQRRFGDAPWAQDRVQDAAFYAWASWVGYNTDATDGSAIPAYKPAEDGKDNTFTRVNRILGMADGLGRQAATQESALDEFIGCFSDLVPDSIEEDAAAYLEERLGGTVTFSPAVSKAYDDDFDGYESALETAIFYVADEQGRKRPLTLREVAWKLTHFTEAEMEAALAEADVDFATERYTDILDRIVTWAMGHDAVVQLVTEEPEPEFCPLAKATITDMKTGQVRVALVDGRQPDYSVQRSDDEAYEAAWDYIDETDMLEEKGYGEAGEIDTLCDVEEGFTLQQEIDFEEAELAIAVLRDKQPWKRVNGCSIIVKRDDEFVALQLTPERAYVLAWRKGLHQQINWRQRWDGSIVLNNDAYLAIAHGVKMDDGYALPYNIDGFDHELLSVIAVGANAVGRDAYLAHVAEEDEEFFGVLVALAPKGQPLNANQFSTQELREVVLTEVNAGRMYPSQAAILLAKLSGKHQNAAKRIGQLVYNNSVQKKAVLGQKRVDQAVEMLWAEQESRGLFGLELPKHLVSVVGKLSEHAVADFGRWSAKIRQECAIVGCSDDARALAQKYNIRYIEVPVFQGYNGPMVSWAEMQCLSIANLSYVGQCNQQKVKAMAQAFGHRFIGLTK